jgi:hypothetical protein
VSQATTPQWVGVMEAVIPIGGAPDASQYPVSVKMRVAVMVSVVIIRPQQLVLFVVLELCEHP